MLAGMLHGAGYYMGEELLPPTSSNPKGYFEDRAVNNLNEDLLLQLVPAKPLGPRGRLYPRRLAYGHRWLAALDAKATVRATPELQTRMLGLVGRRPFCFKDPRFCYTLDAWRPFLGDAVFLCIFREPGRTAASMLKDSRERSYLQDVRLTRRRALAVWTAMYTHVLERHCQHDGEWLFVHYDQVLEGSALARIERAIACKLNAGFSDPTLKRSPDAGSLPRAAREVYSQLCELAGLP